MKKLIIVISIVVIVVAPYFLPMPLFASSLRSQYALGDTFTVELAVWNISPITRSYTADDATDLVLSIDGQPLATTKTKISTEIRPFARVEQDVSYTISKTPATSVRFNEQSGQIELPEGPHDISVQWLGSSSLSHKASFVEL